LVAVFSKLKVKPAVPLNWSFEDAGAQRLMSVPGIGPIISSTMVAAIGTGATPPQWSRHHGSRSVATDARITH
jgi:hypothetical protein